LIFRKDGADALEREFQVQGVEFVDEIRIFQAEHREDRHTAVAVDAEIEVERAPEEDRPVGGFSHPPAALAKLFNFCIGRESFLKIFAYDLQIRAGQVAVKDESLPGGLGLKHMGGGGHGGVVVEILGSVGTGAIGLEVRAPGHRECGR